MGVVSLRLAAAGLVHRTKQKARLLLGESRCTASTLVGRLIQTDVRSVWVGPLAAALLSGCAGEPTTFAVPSTAAARIRLVCPPGTFVGTMTVNCPQPLPRSAPAQ